MLEPEKEERPTIPEPAKCTNALMQASLTKLIRAADRYQASGEYDFRDEINKAQNTWLSWRDAECQLVGAMVEGNADTIAVIRCQSASNLARARQLDQQADDIAARIRR